MSSAVSTEKKYHSANSAVLHLIGEYLYSFFSVMPYEAPLQIGSMMNPIITIYEVTPCAFQVSFVTELINHNSYNKRKFV